MTGLGWGGLWLMRTRRNVYTTLISVCVTKFCHRDFYCRTVSSFFRYIMINCDSYTFVTFWRQIFNFEGNFETELVNFGTQEANRAFFGFIFGHWPQSATILLGTFTHPLINTLLVHQKSGCVQRNTTGSWMSIEHFSLW